MTMNPGKKGSLLRLWQKKEAKERDIRLLLAAEEAKNFSLPRIENAQKFNMESVRFVGMSPDGSQNFSDIVSPKNAHKLNLDQILEQQELNSQGGTSEHDRKQMSQVPILRNDPSKLIESIS